MKAVFRADASKGIGSGHVRRCLSLADALCARGVTSVFATNSEAKGVVPDLARYENESNDIAPHAADFLIVDHYGLNASYEKLWRPHVGKIMVIDDLADRTHDCDVLLDQTFGRKAEDYAPHVPSSCRILTGSHYALLRPQFAAARTQVLAWRAELKGRIERLFVTFGGIDGANLTGLTLEALQKIPEKLSVDIIIERGHAHRAALEESAGSSVHNIKFHHDVEDVAALMGQADLAIGAGGTTNWERCCLGLPALAYQTAENQAEILRNLADEKALIFMGKAENAIPTALAATLHDLISNPERCMMTSAAAARICDGKGCCRLTDILMEMK